MFGGLNLNSNPGSRTRVDVKLKLNKRIATILFVLRILQMPRRTLAKGKFYHIYNRGHEKQQLFFKQKDYEKFYNNIARYREKYPDIQIVSWSLLPNHFHFLVFEKQNLSNPGSENGEPGFISEFMNRIQQSYATFFNTKYRESVKQGKKGPVFEGRFKAKIVEDEDYLLQLQRYIEWNAVKHDLVDKPEEWGYTSFIPGSIDFEPEVGLEFNPHFE
jgi:putative transposase